MSDNWLASVPVLKRFNEVGDPTRYAPLPSDWIIGLSDVVRSTAAIEDGQYKAVNLAGAATISAVTNALGGQPPLFAFGGDGAQFGVPPEHALIASDALSSVSHWVESDLGLRLRVGTTSVSRIRAAGLEVSAAFWQASENVRYTMFAGDGIEWAEAQLKSGTLDLPNAPSPGDPDLTGLSCQWGPVRSKQGKIVSLIVKRAATTPHSDFVRTVNQLVEILDRSTSRNPVPVEGPEVRWPAESIDLQSRVALRGHHATWRRFGVFVGTALVWLLFKLGCPVGRFDPKRYRREITANTDFRKYNDGLMMTLDCSVETIEQLTKALDHAAAEGVIRFGLHEQDEALMTCVVPSVLSSDHMHFIDGSNGGYAAAAKMLRERDRR